MPTASLGRIAGRRRRVRALVIAALAASAIACATRPPGIPLESWQALPWGAVSLDGYGASEDLGASSQIVPAPIVDKDQYERPRYAVLALSGGGANGAFGAGLLAGWSKHGSRPSFKIVTGVSTGSLLAVYAFLGPKYDRELERFYTTTTDADVLSMRSRLSSLFGDSLADNAPLKATIARAIDDRVLDEVAREHRRGRRLYVSTTDLDGARVVAWDMGAIAASARPDRLQRFRDVLLASTSIPVVFPPVYFPVEVGGATYSQMHVDGGATANLLFAGFMIDVLRATEGSRFRPDARIDFYTVINGYLRPGPHSDPIAPDLLGIAVASNWITSWAAQSSLVVRLYHVVRRVGWEFHLAGIPREYEGELPSASFDPERMTRLFRYAEALAASGFPWQDHPPGMDPRERLAPQ